MINTIPFENFEEASRAVLDCLHARLGFGLWMMTRTDGTDWVVLQARDCAYHVEEGTSFRWSDSFCSRMVQGQGPRVAPRASEIPAYVEAPIGKQVVIGAYIGVPVVNNDGTLFGTLCAINPEPMDEAISHDLPFIELCARFLGTALMSDFKVIALQRQLEHVQQLAATDGMTGLLNRRGWDQVLVTEESRSKRYGNPACVFIIDLDGLKRINDNEGHHEGDALIRRAARTIRNAVRESDSVARLGGDEFAVLAIECDLTGAEALYKNITNDLRSNGISASVGKTMRDPRLGLGLAVEEADRAMYSAKSQKRILTKSQSTSDQSF